VRGFLIPMPADASGESWTIRVVSPSCPPKAFETVDDVPGVVGDPDPVDEGRAADSKSGART